MMTDETMLDASDVKFGVLHLTPKRLHRLRLVPTVIVGALGVFVVAWVLFLADRSWTTETSAGWACAPPGEGGVCVVNGITACSSWSPRASP